MQPQKYDLIVIGGGRASNLAIKAGNKGERVALIERDALGGTCPNRGCVPSKLLIGYADVAHHIHQSKRFFIDAETKSIDVKQIFAETNLANPIVRFSKDLFYINGRGDQVH